MCFDKLRILPNFPLGNSFVEDEKRSPLVGVLFVAGILRNPVSAVQFVVHHA